MVVISELILRYAAVGADQAQRADGKVRDSVNTTGKTARREELAIKRWLDATKVSLAVVGGVLVGIVGGLIAASPMLTANMASIRLGLGLLADEILDPLQPAIDGLTDAIFKLGDAYAKLPEPVRQVTSGVLLGAFALGSLLLAASGALAALGPLIKAFKLIPEGIEVSAGLVYGLAVAIGTLLGIIAVWALDKAGIFDWLAKFSHWLSDRIPQSMIDLITALLGGVASIGALFVGFVRGGFGGAGAAFQEMFGKWMAAWGHLKDDIGGILNSIGSSIADWAKGAWHWGADLVANLVAGIKSGLGAVGDAAKSVRDKIASYLSFDLTKNDAMALRWGNDFGRHFQSGVQSGMQNWVPGAGLQAPLQAPGAGGRGATSIVHLTFEKGSITNTGGGAAQLDEDRLVEKVVKKVSTTLSGRTTR